MSEQMDYTLGSKNDSITHTIDPDRSEEWRSLSEECDCFVENQFPLEKMDCFDGCVYRIGRRSLRVRLRAGGYGL